MTLLLAWTRIELRRRWRALLVLALLVALAAGTVLTVVAGARRSVSAVDRLLAQTLPATAVVSPQDPAFDWNAVQALPGVQALTLFPGYAGFGIDEAPGETVSLYLPADAEAMRTVERPVVLDGRLADPARADEAVVTAQFVTNHGYGVGDTVTLRLFTPEQVDTGVSGVEVAMPPRPEGPTQPVRIVGVVRSLWHTDGVGETGRLFPSAGLIETHRANILGAAGDGALNAIVRLRDGQAGLEAFRADLARIAKGPDVDVTDRAIEAERVRGVAAFQAGSLLAFGLAALVAAVVLIGQALARYTAATAADLRVLGALGMTRRQLLLGAAAGPLIVGVGGALLGVGVAVVASQWMPFGASATVEPAPGVDADVLVLGAGLLLVPAMVVAAAVATAAGALAGAASPTAGRRSAVARLAAATGLPVPIVVGARFALEPGRGPAALPVRPALIGAVAGVLGLVAAATVAAGVADAAEHPARFGQTYQVVVGFGYNGDDLGVPVPPVLAALRADPEVESVGDVRYAVAGSGPATVLTFTDDPASGSVLTVLTAGRAPTAPREVLLTPTTARLLGAGIGSTVPFAGNTGSVDLTVVGFGLLPQTEYNGYDTGAWVGAADYDRLFGAFFLNHAGFLTLRPGADPLAVIPRLESASAAAGGGPFLFPDLAPVPGRLAEIRDLSGLPLTLGAFLALVAVGAVGHSLVTAIRRRRRDVAVLRAVGMTRRQARGIAVTQATVLAAVGLTFGVPLGLALGRALWRFVADATPLQYQAPVAVLALLLVAPVALVVANALAAWPGRQAARLRVGQILRAE